MKYQEETIRLEDLFSDNVCWFHFLCDMRNVCPFTWVWCKFIYIYICIFSSVLLCVSFSWNTLPYYIKINLKIGLPHLSPHIFASGHQKVLQLKIRLQCSFFFNKHIRPPKIGFRHLLTLQVANHTWQTDLALLGFKGGEVIIVLSKHMSKEVKSNTSQRFLFYHRK